MEHKILGILLVIVAIGLFILTRYIDDVIINILLIVAGIDLLCTVLFKRPLIKAGPLAKFLYGAD